MSGSPQPKPSRSLARIAGIVAIATLISKLFGFVREQAIARAFGVGPVVNAYAYAYIIPGFLLILLGGINGPFHSALVSVLAKSDREEAGPLVEAISTLVTTILLAIALGIFLLSPQCIDLLAPGLDGEVRNLAILQLRIMTPLAVLAGLIGIGFGTLNAADQYWLPSISPLFSSLAIVGGVLWLLLTLGDQLQNPEYLQLGGIILAGTTLGGGILQWLAQVAAQSRANLGQLRWRWDWRSPKVKEVLKVMAPATLSSGMLHINVYTDMFFASYIATAAAAMRYANFIVLTPLGIISNMILVPFLPVFSRLAAPENWDDLKIRIRQGLMLCALTMLPLSAIFLALAVPIIRLVYEYNQFQADATQVVAPVLMAYGLGMFFYLGRDVLVRVFYALGDGETPFRISVFNIFLNALLDYGLVNRFQTPGLVFATIGVNVVSMGIMLWVLHQRLQGLPLLQWGRDLLWLMGGSAIAGGGAWGLSVAWERYLGSENLLFQLLQLGLSATVALGIFGAIAWQRQLPEMAILTQRLGNKFGGRFKKSA